MKIMTKKEAWAKRGDEKFIEIKNRKKYKFCRRWFHHRNCCTFSTFLPDAFPPDIPHYVLTIGVFEGMQEVWLMQNILRHRGSRLVGIDPWLSYEHHRKGMDQEFADQVLENAKHNLSEWREQVVLIRAKSQDVLKAANICGQLVGIPAGQFDLIIIDGDHMADAVFEDAVNSYGLLCPGGWMLFDDVRCNRSKPGQVKDGLERFLSIYGDKVEWVWGHRFCDCFRKVGTNDKKVG